MDKIADMLTKIRNAQMAGHKEVCIDASRLKLAIAKILEKEGFIESVSTSSEGPHNQIKINLKYYPITQSRRMPAIKGIKRISHGGQRIYIKKNEIKPVKNKYGIAIISTSRGIMTGEESRKMGLGGEYICEVW